MICCTCKIDSLDFNPSRLKRGYGQCRKCRRTAIRKAQKKYEKTEKAKTGRKERDWIKLKRNIITKIESGFIS